MGFELMELPFEVTGLEPYISAETIEYHYSKHHATYVEKLNGLIKGTKYENSTLQEIVQGADDGIFNNAAQVYNHDFYWNGLTGTATIASTELSTLLNENFGSLEGFKEKFFSAAVGLFGSGWVWLILTDEGKLVIETTSNAGSPIRYGKKVLLTCDVWEHAYYIDYRNLRPKYLQNWFKVINWKFVSDNFAQAKSNLKSEYTQLCNDDEEVCDYIDPMQEDEHIAL
ncbi:MAG: Fe-Mn family superoxide dismutase [Sulfurimonas sp.]|jgi:Fe-Mn family superoxide dismutase|uniref:superoxide dismutase n=1 Tax=Sulfurimonas sp. TaxID=2022749 RepID=UPI0039E31BDD